LDELSRTWLGSKKIEDFEIYPATPLQEGLLVQNLLQGGSYSYITQFRWKTNGVITVEQLEIGLQKFLGAHDIFRTRFVPTSMGVYQLLARSYKASVFRHNDVEEYCLEAMKRGFRPEDDFWFRIGAIESDSEVSHVVLTMHHVLYDGWCLSTVINDLMRAFSSENVETTTPFRKVVEYIHSQDEEKSRKYWNSYLKDFSPLPSLNPKGYRLESSSVIHPYVATMLSCEMEDMKKAASTIFITTATIAKAAWALTLTKFFQQDDVVFGSVVSGRNMDITGIEKYKMLI
jgi:hypothetical protein